MEEHEVEIGMHVCHEATGNTIFKVLSIHKTHGYSNVSLRVIHEGGSTIYKKGAEVMGGVPYLYKAMQTNLEAKSILEEEY